MYGEAPVFYAELPQAWVDNTVCNPDPSVGYDTTVTIASGSNMLGAIIAAANTWGQADTDTFELIQVPPGLVTTTITGSSGYDADNAMWSLPGKLISGSEPTKCLVIDSTTPLVAYDVAGAVSSGTFTTNEVIEQTTTGVKAVYMGVAGGNDLELGPICAYWCGQNYAYGTTLYTWVGQTSGAVFTPTSTPSPRMACGRGLPGFGGARNPGCASPDDKASMWKIELPAPQSSIHRVIYGGADLTTPANWVNHIVIRDAEVTLAPGAAQSSNGVYASSGMIFIAPNPLGTIPCVGCQAVDSIIVERNYLHGNDPGSPGQPTTSATGGLLDSAGTCTQFGIGEPAGVTNWPNGAATVSVDATGLIITRVSGGYFGPTMYVGETVDINGHYETIATFNPASSNTSFTIASADTADEGTTVAFSTTNSSNNITSVPSSANPSSQANMPPVNYTPGCGDDIEKGIVFDADNSSAEGNYIEQIHWGWGSDSQAMMFGFNNGPVKITHNWFEGGSETLLDGGAPVDTQGGTVADGEIRENYIGADLNLKYLTGATGQSPHPPWGCGPIDTTASHTTCPFNWDKKNTFELKLANRLAIVGNIIENSWADGQDGYCVVSGPRTCSGGAACGIYDPVTGLPRTAIHDVRWEGNWIRNCPEPFTTGTTSGTIGNGGGVSLPLERFDYIDNLMSNINDTNQNANPGNQWQWGLNEINFTCTASYTGSGPYTVTQHCLPYQSSITPSSISSVANGSACSTLGYGSGSCSTVTVDYPERIDPMLAYTGTAATAITNGWTAVISGVSGWNGAFAMASTTGNWASDGTGGTNLVYADYINNPGTTAPCGTTAACNTFLGSGNFSFASLGFKITGIAPPGSGNPTGDAIYAYNVGGGDTTCSANGYAVGGGMTGTPATSAPTYAMAGTTGLTVVYQVATQPSASSANCMVSNGAGFPKYVTVQNNTVLAPNQFAIKIYDSWQYSISNSIFNNVFADNDSGNSSDLLCSASPPEGTSSFACWDLNTFRFYQNVLTARNASNWSVVNCPGGSCSNSFPTTVNCSGSSADATCLGYAGFMGSSPSVTYPSGACVYDGSNPFNCPLMALPWANNFTYTDVSYAGSSSYSNLGVNTTQLDTAMKQTKYVCPAGASCGAHGPYPD